MPTGAEQTAGYEAAATEAKDTASDTVVQADAGTGTPGATDGAGQDASGQPVWDGKQFTLKFTDKFGKPVEYAPKSRDELVNWAQKGRYADTRLAELNQREQELKKLETELAQYKKMAQSFDSNPQFKGEILKLYNRIVNGIQDAKDAGDSAAASEGQDQLAQVKNMIAQELNPFKEKLQEFDTFKQTEAEKAADEQLEKEISGLKSAHATHDWTTPDENGMTLEKRLIKLAFDKHLGTMEDAYRLYMFDHIEENARAEALKKEEERKKKERDQGIVSGGAGAKPKPVADPNPSNLNYNQIAENAVKDFRKSMSG